MNTLSPLTELKGIGEKTEKLFAKVGSNECRRTAFLLSENV